jgi:cytochrome P450
VSIAWFDRSGGTSVVPVSDLPTFPPARRCPFDPPPELGNLREREPVSQARIWDGSAVWLVTGYDDQRAVLADPRFSADAARPGYPHISAGSAFLRQRSQSFLAQDDPEHGVFRRMLTSEFTIRRIEALRPRIQSIVDELIDDLIEAGPPADLVTRLALPVPSRVICELLGVPYADHGFFQRLSGALVSGAAAPRKAVEAGIELRAYLAGLLDDKVREPADDLLSRLAAERLPTGELTETQIADLAVLLLVAGHETTANMISLGTLALLEHPAQLALLRKDPEPALVASAVEEMLRYLTVSHRGRRRVAREDVEVGGRLIRAGEGVIATNDSGNRDPSAFPDPDTLDLTRNARHHLAFGFGPHQCLGQGLARVELQVVYGTLYRRLPELRLAVGLDEIAFTDKLIYGVERLPVEW